ncbi:MAG TPA: thioredoxin family protein [Polyangiaceae bacterium]
MLARCRLLFACGALGCAPPSPAAHPPKHAAANSAPVEPAPELTALPAEPAISAVEPAVHHGIPWYRDAPAAAFERARKEQKPVVVDLWAPWCHTCLSMQEYVLRSEKLPDAAAHFVFLSIDTERAENAEFLKTLTLSAWPTFYVLSPEARVRGRWVGAASPGQFARFLADARRAEELSHAGAGASDPASLLVAADELAASGRFAEAARAYERALAAAPPDWPRRADALLARVIALKKAQLAAACVDAALAERPDAAHPISQSDFSGTVLDCAADLASGDRRVTKLRRLIAELLEPLCARGHAELTPDDRGDACGILIEARESLRDAKGARRALHTRLSVLEAAAAGLPDELASMYDFARSETLVKLGRGALAIELLEARERALPQNYNPPHQLARVYRSLQRWDEGLLAIDRALALAYGPRKAGLYGVKVDLLLGKGRRTEAANTLAEQLAVYQSLPEGQKRPDAEAKVRARIVEF